MPPTTTTTPETRLLSAQLRAQDPKALARVVAMLRRKHGDIGATVEALGVKRSTWYRWAAEVPGFAEAIEGLVRAPGGQGGTWTLNGVTKRPIEWAAELGHKPKTLLMRVASGMPLERALTRGPLREAPAAEPAAKKKRAKRRAKTT